MIQPPDGRVRGDITSVERGAALRRQIEMHADAALDDAHERAAG